MDALMKEQDVALAIGLTVHWLRRMRWLGGGIPFCKLNEHGAVRYRKEDVDEFIASKVRRCTCERGG